ncbi:hypothetical protein Deipr_0784 [Deinococcus proteolyticus MRP]|uniref:Uncharacterized protein n=2 Tax=Deinococcus proteolyticus TaxID=55148 RepID=F0RM20_DEIPM|nr:hypothetical protein Deipr_0784 [Deinococcus proteolyticus MRP]
MTAHKTAQNVRKVTILTRMRADDWLEELVQLYEYRVEDLVFGRSPRGDRHSFQALRETLLFSDALDGAARSRLMQTERQFRELQRQGRVHFSVATQLRQAPSPASDLQDTLQRLSDRLWESDVRRWLFARLWATRSEPRLMPLRLLSTVSDNLLRQQRGQVAGPLLTLEAALEAGLTGLPQIEALSNILLTLLSTAGGRERLDRAIQDLEQQETAAPAPGPAGLPGTLPVQAEDRQLLSRTAAAIRLLLSRWPARNPVRGSAELLTPDLQETGAPVLAVNLSELEEPRSVHWRELALQLRRCGPDAEMRLGERGAGEKERCLALRGDLPAELRLWSFDLGGQLIHAVLEDDLLLLRSERAAPRALQVLANRARLCIYLAQPHQAFAPMRLARAAALLLRGRTLEGTDLSAASAARYAAATPPQLGQLAARGLEALLALSSALPEWQRTQRLQEAAQALGLSPAEGQLMSELLGTAGLPDLIFDPQVLRSGGLPVHRTFALLDWPAVPVELDVDGQQVRLSGHPPRSPDEEAGLGAELENLPPQPLDDLLAWPLEQASLSLVRHEGWLAYTTIPYGAQQGLPA